MKVKYFIIAAAVVVAFFIGGHFPSSNYLDMEKVIGYDTTETGLMLQTQTGGYYWEKGE